jgi:hypothetical protein
MLNKSCRTVVMRGTIIAATALAVALTACGTAQATHRHAGEGSGRLQAAVAPQYDLSVVKQCRHVHVDLTATSGTFHYAIVYNPDIPDLRQAFSGDLVAGADADAASTSIDTEYQGNTGEHHWLVRIDGDVVRRFTVQTAC